MGGLADAPITRIIHLKSLFNSVYSLNDREH